MRQKYPILKIGIFPYKVSFSSGLDIKSSKGNITFNLIGNYFRFILVENRYITLYLMAAHFLLLII